MTLLTAVSLLSHTYSTHLISFSFLSSFYEISASSTYLTLSVNLTEGNRTNLLAQCSTCCMATIAASITHLCLQLLNRHPVSLEYCSDGWPTLQYYGVNVIYCLEHLQKSTLLAEHSNLPFGTTSEINFISVTTPWHQCHPSSGRTPKMILLVEQYFGVNVIYYLQQLQN